MSIPLVHVAVGLTAFGYAVFGIGISYAGALQQARVEGHFPAQELLAGILTDPLLLLTLFLIHVLPGSWRVTPFMSPAWLMRAGSMSRIFQRSLLPLTVRGSLTTWMIVYAVVGLAVMGGWLATDCLPMRVSPDLLIVLSSQFARGVLVFILATFLLGLTAMTSPQRFRQSAIGIVAVLLWLVLFLLASMPDLVPRSLNAITVLSAGAEESITASQLRIPAQLLLTVLVAVTFVGLIDVGLARVRHRKITFPSTGIFIVVMSAAFASLLMSETGPSVPELFSGYNGSLSGVAVEVSLTLAPAVATWLAMDTSTARGWAAAVSLRAGTYTAALGSLLRSGSMRVLQPWCLLAMGVTLGMFTAKLGPLSNMGGRQFDVVTSVMIGGLLQTLIYLVILLSMSFLTRSIWAPTVSVILLATVPPPGIRVRWLPMHAAFDSAAVLESPSTALRSGLILVLGLLMTAFITISLATLRDYVHKASLKQKVTT